MEPVNLYVAGITYTNNPAGKLSLEFRTSQSGGKSDEVWYQVDTSIISEAILGEEIRMGYLDAQSRGQLNEMGVTFKSEKEVRDSGMGNYILWMRPHGAGDQD